jgi:dTMP kinase
LGLFITFEGIEGCGKSTQARLLGGYLEGRGHEVVPVREPGGTALGEKVRAILLEDGPEPIAPVAELLLYEACRAQITERVIYPALARGATVVCDRFTDSTVAYQGFARGLGAEAVERVNRMAAPGPDPDLTLVIDCEPEVGLDRAWERIKSSRGPGEDRFEREEMEFHRKVRQGYLELARAEPGRVKVIDGGGTVEEVHARVIEAVGPIVDTTAPGSAEPR